MPYLTSYLMTTLSTQSRRSGGLLAGGPEFCEWVTSTNNRLYVGWFGVLMIPCLLTAAACSSAFIAAPPVTSMESDKLRVLLCGNIISRCCSSIFKPIGLHFLPYLGSSNSRRMVIQWWSYQLIIFHFLIGISAYMGRQWELSYRIRYETLDICSIFSTCINSICCIRNVSFGRGSFSDGMPLGIWYIQLYVCVPNRATY